MTIVLKRRASEETAQQAMKLFVRTLLAAIVIAVMPVAACRGADTIRVAVQKTGTFAWEQIGRAHV